MAPIQRKRKFLIWGFVLGSIAFLIALPIWLPWVLKPVLKKYGVRFAAYQRDGYNGFTLHQVTFANPKLAFEADRITCHFARRIQVSDWNLDLEKSKNSTGDTSVASAVHKMDNALAQLNGRAKMITLRNGKVRSGNLSADIPSLEYSGALIVADVSSTNRFPETHVQIQLGPTSEKQIHISTPGWNLDSYLKVIEEAQGVDFRGYVSWQTNRTEIVAHFGPAGALPETARVQAKSFHVPPRWLQLEGFRDLAGSFNAVWRANQFVVDLAAHAQPLEGDDAYISPVEFQLHAVGDTNSVRLEKAHFASPWLEAALSQNVQLDYRGKLLSPSAELKISADLSRQKWIAATGRLTGQAVLRRSESKFADAEFILAGAQIGVADLRINRLDIQGEFAWPWLNLTRGKIQFEDGALAETDLRFNAVTRSISDGRMKLSGSFGHAFLPPEISYKNVLMTAAFSGPLKKLRHKAHVELNNFILPPLTPLQVVADWEGEKFSLENFNAVFSAKNSDVSMAGAANVQTNAWAVQLRTLAFRKNQKNILDLEAPVSISATNKTKEWSIAVSPARLQGTTNEISLGGTLELPRSGTIDLAAQQIELNQFGEFFAAPLPEIFLDKLALSGGWTNGPVNFSVSARARFLPKGGEAFSADIESAGNADGVSVARAEITTASERVLSGNGFLPIRIEPANVTNRFPIIPKKSIRFEAASAPNAEFWQRVAQWTGADLRDPSVSISVSGTMDSPEGRILASAREIILKPKTNGFPMPRLKNLLADIHLERERIAVNRFEVFVEGQPVTATAELPLPKSFETHWRKVLDWHKASGRLKIVDAQIAPFSRLFPKILSPLGTIYLDVSLAPGGKMNGELRVAGAALRPVTSLGAVQDIDARIKLAGDEVKVDAFKGIIGGQSVDFFGAANLAKFDSATSLPLFEFHLQGTNVPLARRPELILRSDLDLKFDNAKGGEPLISGGVNLRESFYLGDLKFLVPGKVAKPKQRPPYFSVETEPFSRWKLDVAVRGNEFLRVRSPLFRGEISANFKVAGTLKEPEATGDARINSGVIQFPFSNLRVDQGFVSLTSENPARPRLAVTASSRTFGYDVKMDLSGFADKPNIEFSSNPGLRSEQILLMLTAGELPREELSFSTQQKAGRVAFFLGKNLFSKFGGNGAEDRLEIRSGEDISEQGQQTYFLEYKLTEDWSIIGEYDRFGGVNAGVKWKFFEQ